MTIKTKKDYPGIEEIKFIFEYRDGKLFWKNKPSLKSNIIIGNEAGWKTIYDRWEIGFNKQIYKRSILVWIYHGNYYDKSLVIDHIDRNKLNDHINNLRQISHSNNQRNRNLGCNNIIIRNDRFSKYQVYFYIDGKKHSKCFKILEDAKIYRDKFITEYNLKEFYNYEKNTTE